MLYLNMQTSHYIIIHAKKFCSNFFGHIKSQKDFHNYFVELNVYIPANYAWASVNAFIT